MAVQIKTRREMYTICTAIFYAESAPYTHILLTKQVIPTMTTILLAIIYLTFISIGLPNSLLGSAWPLMHPDLGVPLSNAGIISVIISGGMIISSFFSGRLMKRFSTESITITCVALTVLGFLGYWLSPSFIWVCVASLPLGLTGAIDAVVSHFVSLNYQPRHMNWIHCFWGVGASLGPIILSFFMGQDDVWRNGYLAIAMVQLFVLIALIPTFPLWKKVSKAKATEKQARSESGTSTSVNTFQIKGVKTVLASFFLFCSMEATVGLWGSSYLVECKNMPSDFAARWVSLFFIGTTVGRFVSGFVTIKVSSHILIRGGLVVAGIGAVALLLPLPVQASMVGLLMLGFGCAPLFPCMLQETPRRFGEKASASIIGIQMAFAFMGSTFMPPLLGLIAARFGIAVFPFFICAYMLLMMISTEAINRMMKKNPLVR